MRTRFVPASALAAAALLAIVAAACARPAPSGAAGIPTVAVDFVAGGIDALFAASGGDERTDQRAHFRDVDGTVVPAKAGRRGFSAWHHDPQKPSLRIEQAATSAPLRPRHVELSRPEDPLALANWLPDRLCEQLGLLHARTTPVQLLLDGDDHGVYLRSLRPGDDLAAAAGRPRGTFWKGDAIGERKRLDLWADAAAWRSSGASSARAQALLQQLLALLREPAGAANLARLGSVLDVDAAARTQAIAVLVASIHADRAHNHVLFADPTSDRLEPLLWDANGFGIHAEPGLPVDVARHPLAERLLCDPAFVHARNEQLWRLLADAGSALALTTAARAHVDAMARALAFDPQIARLRLQRGQFVVEPVAHADLPDEFARFAAFVAGRERMLRAYFADARVDVAADPAHPGRCIATVSGHVAVRVTAADGSPVRSVDGRPADLLLPGLSAELHPAPQHRAADGHGVPAPHARPAPLAYALAATPGSLRFCNAFTGAVVTPGDKAPSPVATRSVHPWAEPPPPPGLRLGPGPVRLDHSLDLDAATTLTILPGTRLQLAAGASIRTRGPVQLVGSNLEPIAIEVQAGDGPALACVRNVVRLEHVSVCGPRPTLLSLHGCTDARLANCTLRGASGDGLVVAGGSAQLRDVDVALSRGHALVAHAGARVRADGCRFAFADHGVVARDAAVVHLQAGEIAGNMVGVLAEGGSSFAGATVVLTGVRFRDIGRQEAATTGDGVVVRQDAAASPPR